MELLGSRWRLIINNKQPNFLEEIMVTWKKVLSLLTIFMVLLTACASGAASTELDRSYLYATGDTEANPAAPPANSVSEEEKAGEDISVRQNTPTDIALPDQPLIIRTGDLNLLVTDTDQAVVQITALVQGMEGWVLNTSLQKYGDYRQGSITVRVPVEQFDTALQQIKALSTEVLNESQSGQDVTEEYVDLTARLGNLEATVERVRVFLDEAKTVEEALQVNAELSRLESEIEQIKGRMKYLSQSAAFSTITTYLTPDIAEQPVEIAGWRPTGVAKIAFENLVEGLQDLVDFLIYFVIGVLPFLLLIGIPGYFIGRGVVRWGRNRRRPTPPPAAKS